MKQSEVKCGAVKLTKRFSAFLVSAAVALCLTAANVTAAEQQLPVDLGSAANFAVLGASTVTNTGLTVINGDLGLWPGTAVTGFYPPGTVNGTIHAGDPVAQQAQASLTVAYNDAAGRTVGVVSVAGDLGGQTLAPGLYKSTSTIAITGDLTLDAQGDPNAVFIFQVGSGLTVATGGRVVLIGGAKADNVFWQVGSSATLGTNSALKGTVMAYASITIATGATLDGRALAQTAAVTLDTNIITAVIRTNQAVVLDAIADVTLDEGSSSSVTVNASDADNDLITVTASLPAFATLLAPTTGTGSVTTAVSINSGFSDAGSYSASVTATDGIQPVTEPFSITVNNVDRPVALDPIADLNVAEGASASRSVNASDPDSDPITLSASLPAFASLGDNGDGTGSVTAAPGITDAGNYPSSVTATAASTTATSTFTIVVSDFDRAPVLAAISDINVQEGSLASTPVSAADADGETIALTASLPTFATLDAPTSGAGTVSTTVTASPASGGAGNYPSSVTATANGLTDTENFSINVTGPNAGQLPVDLGSAANFAVLGASTVTNTGPTVINGDLGLWPGTSVTGFYPPGTVNGTMHVTDPVAQQAQASLAIAYNDAAGRTVGVVGVAGDLGGQTLAPGLYKSTSTIGITGDLTLDAQGDPNAVFIFQVGSGLTVATGGRVVLIGGAKADNVFWQVGSSATLGTYSALKGTVMAYASITIATGATLDGRALAQTAAVTLDTNIITATVNNVDRPVALDPIADLNVAAGSSASRSVNASDPDSDPITLSASLPPFASLSDNGDGTGSVTAAPGITDAGNYPSSVTATANGLTDTENFSINVTGPNQVPSISAPATETVDEGQNLNFTVTAADGDNDPLTLAASGVPVGASFLDNGNGTGTFDWTPSSDQAGTYTVTFNVSDGKGGTNSASTGITVNNVDCCPTAMIFTTGGNNTTSLSAGKQATCVQIEPVGGSFAISDVDLSTIKMLSDGTGSVSQIFAGASKTAVDGDKNSNGVSEIRACFTKADLRLLFSGLPAGRNTVTVAIEGNLTTGGKFHGELVHTVKSTGGALAATVSPNPLNPETTLSFQLRTPGRVTVKVFDLNGRLVKTLLDDTRGAGFQNLTWNGTAGSGVKVASGVYYFRLDTPDGRIVKAATVLK